VRAQGVRNGGNELPVLPLSTERVSDRIVRNCDCVYTAAVWFGCSGISRRSSATQRSSVKGIRAGQRRKHRSFRTQLFLTRYRHRLPFRLAVLSLADCWSGRPVLHLAPALRLMLQCRQGPASPSAGFCWHGRWLRTNAVLNAITIHTEKFWPRAIFTTSMTVSTTVRTSGTPFLPVRSVENTREPCVVWWANTILGFRIREANGTAEESSGLSTVFILYSYISM